LSFISFLQIIQAASNSLMRALSVTSSDSARIVSSRYKGSPVSEFQEFCSEICFHRIANCKLHLESLKKSHNMSHGEER